MERYRDTKDEIDKLTHEIRTAQARKRVLKRIAKAQNALSREVCKLELLGKPKEVRPQKSFND